MEKSTHEEHLSQSLHTIKKQFKISINFLNDYNGIFNVTSKNTKFYFAQSISDKDGFLQFTTPPGDYEIETLNDEISGIIIEEGNFTEVDYPFTIKPIFFFNT